MSSAAPRLSPALVVLFAVGAGLSVASLYYNQPILGAMTRDLGASVQAVGYVPMATQLGYAAGILLSAPLGDRLDRRRVIVVKTAALAFALLLAGLSRSIEVLCVASLVIGLLATVAQDFVPAAAALAPAASRGKTVGSVMTGLLLGILLSRVVSGSVAERFGWRVVYLGAAGTIALLSLFAAKRVPRFTPSSTASYGALLRSIVSLMRDVAPLRRAALAQGLLSVAFSGFWSTLALVLAEPPYRMGSAVAGAFGIVGAAGALLAPAFGSVADRRGPEAVLRASAILVIGSFGAMAAFPSSLPILVVTTVLFDLGVQASVIAHQTVVYGLDPAARSRLNAVLVSSMFFGMAAGAALASRALAHWGAFGVAVQGVVAGALALIVRLWPAGDRRA
jgi:predicted MFS family arabinose efflux permease